MPPRKDKPKTTPKQAKFVEGVVRHGNATKAAVEAGYSPKTAKVIAHENLTKPYLIEEIQRRNAEVMKLAQIHTDVITGWLVQIASVSPEDCVDKRGNFDINKARRTGAIHAIRKLEKTDKGFKFELYPRLDAISQLRDNFGMKQEPRANTYEATRQAEVEKELEKIMQAESCSKADAAKMLREALGSDSPLIPTVNKYVN